MSTPTWHPSFRLPQIWQSESLFPGKDKAFIPFPSLHRRAVGTNFTLDDASSAIYYIDFPVAQVNPACATTGTCSYSNTLHQSALTTASAAFQVKASALFIYGLQSPSGGPFTVTIDGVTYGSLTGYCETPISQALLFHMDGLDPTTAHQVVMKNAGPSVLTLDFIVATSGGVAGSTAGGATPAAGAPAPGLVGRPASQPMAASSGTDVFGQPLTGPTAEKDGNGDQIGAIIGAVAGVIIFLVIAFMVLRSHRKAKSADATPVALGTAATAQIPTQPMPNQLQQNLAAVPRT